MPRKPSKWEQKLGAQLAGLGAWQSEFRFHPVRRWVFDFALPQLRIAVEAEGATYAGGRHTRGSGFDGDCEKYNTAAVMGWTVLRFTGRMIEDGTALATVQEAVKRLGGWDV